MIIPYEKLSPDALRGIIEEVVTRDGTEMTDAEDKIAQVLRQLERGKLVVTYDLEIRACNIVTAEAAQDAENDERQGPPASSSGGGHEKAARRIAGRLGGRDW